jgi:transcriptional regulator with XRE-family HTH domain
MARAALEWSVRDLARRAHVGSTTVIRFEGGKPANASTLTLIKQTFEAVGVRFTEDGGVLPPDKTVRN